jgi:hypothetical protein
MQISAAGFHPGVICYGSIVSRNMDLARWQVTTRLVYQKLDPAGAYGTALRTPLPTAAKPDTQHPRRSGSFKTVVAVGGDRSTQSAAAGVLLTLVGGSL